MDERNWNGIEVLEDVEQPCTYTVPVIGLPITFTPPPGTTCTDMPVMSW